MNEPLIIAAVDGYVAAVDHNNGQVVWRHDLHDPRVEARFRNRTTITLAMDPRHVAMVAVTWHEMKSHAASIASWCVRIACCDYLSGRLLWTTAQDVQAWGSEVNIPILEPSVRVQNGQVLVGLSTLSAFDAASGRVLWQSAIAPPPAPQEKPSGFFGALTSSSGSPRNESWNCRIARRQE